MNKQTVGIQVLLVLCATGLLYALLSFGGREKETTGAVTVYAYCDMLSHQDFEKFTEKTGIEVVVRHFESIEEVMTKLIFTGDSGIDLIAPTDAMVEVLVGKGLLQQLDYAQLPAAQELDSRLMKRFYDPSNRYSLPFSWTPVGVGYDTRAVTLSPDQIGWDSIFGTLKNGTVESPDQVYGPSFGKVCVGEDPVETIFLLMIHLYRCTHATLTPAQEAQIIAVLQKQKEWVECYTNNLRYFLVSGVCSAVVIPGAYMIELQQEYPWADFVIPSSGTVMFIGNMAISTKSKKSVQSHAVINYLLSEEGALTCFKNHSFLPANVKACKRLPERVTQHRYLFPNDALFARFSTLHNALSLKKIEQLWQQAIV